MGAIGDLLNLLALLSSANGYILWINMDLKRVGSSHLRFAQVQIGVPTRRQLAYVQSLFKRRNLCQANQAAAL